MPLSSRTDELVRPPEDEGVFSSPEGGHQVEIATGSGLGLNHFWPLYTEGATF